MSEDAGSSGDNEEEEKEGKKANRKRKRRESNTAMAALEGIFQGNLLNQIRSTSTSTTSTSEESGVQQPPSFHKSWKEPFADLALDIVATTPPSTSSSSSSSTLVGSFEAYFKDEVMEGSNAYKAKGIGLLERAVKSCRIHASSSAPPSSSSSSSASVGSCSSDGAVENDTNSNEKILEAKEESGLPEVLHVQLKRFSFDVRTMSLRKVHTPCHFDEDLDLKPFVSFSPHNHKEGVEAGGGVETRYKLHAVLVHQGDAAFGHYYAYVKVVLVVVGRGGGWEVRLSNQERPFVLYYFFTVRMFGKARLQYGFG